MTAVVIGVGVGVLLLAVFAAAVMMSLGADPPAEPSEPVARELADREMLFRPPTWKKGQLANVGDGVRGFNRPMEIQPVPQNSILAPLRDVHGVNGEG